MRPTTSRRHFLAAATACVTTGVAGCAQSDDRSDDREASHTTATTAASGGGGDAGSLPDAVGLETLATGFEVPLDVAFAPDADRRYVADQQGRVAVHEGDGRRDEPFLDLGDGVVVGSETGLLGIELHPDFAQNRRVFVRYSAPRRPGTPEDYSHTFVLAEFEASRDGTRVNPDSERTILEIPEPQGNHNAGDIVFGPDGYLYVAVGDGGGGGDTGNGHVEDWYEGKDGANGQDVTENLLGSVLRIDVDDQEGDENYAVPEDNPLVGRDGLDEHYAWGFRNPWRLSFDGGGSSGDGARLFVADVGQRDFEEVNLVEKGGNYGWNVKEGAHCFQSGDCPDATPEDVRGGEPLIEPVVEYPRSDAPVSGVSVIGGHVYRGSALPGLTGAYVFADLQAEGRLFAATSDDGTWSARVVEVAGGDADKLGQAFAFGRDADGEVYVLCKGADGGGLHRIVPAE